MNQKLIYDLLTEAATAPEDRLRQILNELQAGTRSMIYEIAFVGELWHGMVKNGHQGALPSLFPAFAMFCGDKTNPDAIYAKTDWSLYH